MASDVTNHQKFNRESMLPISLKSDRCKTDVYYSYVFGLFFNVFVATTAYVCVAYDRVDFETFTIIINFYGFTKNPGSSILATLFYILFFSFFVGLLSRAPKILLHLASIALYASMFLTVLFWCLLSIMIVLVGLVSTLRALKIEDNSDFFRLYIHPGLSLIVLCPTAICLKKEKLTGISEIVKTSCSALACFRSVWYFIVFILFNFVTIVMGILLLLFMLSMYFQDNLSRILFYSCILGGFYIYSFLYYFGVAVMSSTITSWHYSQDNKEIPTKSVWKSMKIVCRFHFGTVAFGATIILPILFAIYAACRHSYLRGNNFAVATAFRLVLIGDITNLALIQTSVHGYNFWESTKQSFDLLMKNYSISIVLIKMFEFVVSVIVILPIVFSILLINSCGYSKERMELNLVYNFFGYMTQVLSLPVFMIVGTAVKATLLYRLEKREKQDIQQCIEMNIIRIPPIRNVV